MATENVALVQNGEVVDVIIVEAGDPDGFLALITPDYDFVEVVTGKNPEPGVGWSWTSGSGYTPPPPPPVANLETNKNTIVGDGTDAATVTYTTTDANMVSVTFDVNGVTQDVSIASETAQIQVVSSNPGDTITVLCDGMTVQIGVQ